MKKKSFWAVIKTCGNIRLPRNLKAKSFVVKKCCKTFLGKIIYGDKFFLTFA